ncbi:MAG: hypothetical protein LBE12_18370 [Planctomycetaceae bacterium]|nr:hypothetical protein [Planctomycetaceae bacterium]
MTGFVFYFVTNKKIHTIFQQYHETYKTSAVYSSIDAFINLSSDLHIHRNQYRLDHNGRIQSAWEK